MTPVTELQMIAAYTRAMKQARTRPLLDRPDDVGIDIALIATSFAIGVAALIYLLAI